MPTIDPRIDAYIAASPDFARPILAHIRAVVHAACPDVVETIKWSRPHFEYHGLLCAMSAFKAHCALGFWKGQAIFGLATQKEAMGHFGRITALADLPPKKELAAIVRQAMELNEQGVTLPARTRPGLPRALEVPQDFIEALAAHPQAAAVFDKGPPGFRREYVDWIVGARTGATRERRMAQAILWLAEGKARNWKYASC